MFVSVLFNEPKLLKSAGRGPLMLRTNGFSALQRAEIAEITIDGVHYFAGLEFQCSSTSRNC